MEKSALLSAFTTITYFKGFSLHRTENLSETAEFILGYTKKLEKTKKSSYYEGENISKNNYVEVVSRVKRDNITQDNIGAIMISQIPRVSPTVALIIMKEYKTIGMLINALKENPKVLDNIMIETKGGKSRKISKTSTANIYNYLLPNSQSEISVITK